MKNELLFLTFFYRLILTMLFFWGIVFTFVILVESISQVMENLELESESDRDASDPLLNPLDAETNQNSLTLSQNTVDIKTNSLQNSWAPETDPTSNRFAIETDPLQHDLIAETDISQPSCESTDSTDNASDGNTRILPRINACPTEPAPPVKPNPRPRREEEEAPSIIKPKPPPSTKPAAGFEKPVLRLQKPFDEKDPCAGISREEPTLVTCQGPEIAYSEMNRKTSAFVIGCVLGKSSRLILLYSKISLTVTFSSFVGSVTITLKRDWFEPTEINDKYCCKFFEASVSCNLHIKMKSKLINAISIHRKNTG